MVKYLLLYKDNTTQTSFFYLLEEKSVYQDKRTENVSRVKIKSLSAYGAMLGFILYCSVRGEAAVMAKAPEIFSLWICAMGLLLGLVISTALINYSGRYFVTDNRIEATEEEIRQMYIKGKEGRKTYNVLCAGLAVFSAIATWALGKFGANAYYCLCLVVMWGITGMMFVVKRPLCHYRFRKNSKKA